MAEPGKCAESGFPSPEDFDKSLLGGRARVEAFLQAGDNRNFLNPFLSETPQCKHYSPVPRDTRCLLWDKPCS